MTTEVFENSEKNSVSGGLVTHTNPPVRPSVQFWGRIDEQYFHFAKSYLKNRKNFFYFFAKEKATNVHWQGFFYSTLSCKENLSKAIKTPGHPNGKGFGTTRYPEIHTWYCCKGSGLNEYPKEIYTNMEEMTPDHIKELHHKHYIYEGTKTKDKRIIHFAGNAVPKKPRISLFAKLLDYFEENYDYPGDGHNQPNYRDIKKTVMEFYNNDRRLGGTGIRKRVIEELLYRYVPSFRNYAEKTLDKELRSDMWT